MALDDQSGMVCYKCGALVQRSTMITDDETTLAVCHKCNEVMYLNAKVNVATSMGIDNEKTITNHSGNNTTGNNNLPEQNDILQNMNIR